MAEPLPAADESRAQETPKYTYAFPQASPCGAVVVYTQNGNALDLITTFRAESVGGGRSNALGGFWEVKEMFDVPNKVQDGDAELYREGEEELGQAFTEIIPYEDFKKRVEHLWDGMRHVGAGTNVHAIIQKMLRVSEREKQAILALGPTKEQCGIKPERFLLDAYADAAAAEQDIRTRLADFKYGIEVDAAVKWFGKVKAKSEPAFVPVGGW